MPPWTSINAESSPRALQLGAGLSHAHRPEPDLSGVRGSMQERVPYLPTPELRHPSSSLLQESLEAGVAPTDSGYASALHLVYQPEPPSAAVSKQSCKRAGANEEGESCEYTQTVYSEATTADPADSRAYVSELCLDIHDKIRRKTSLAPLPELFGTLPRLIKTLAVKIGQESDSQVNRDIMYFLHKSHREICGLLEELFLHGDEPDIKASDQGPEHMSIQEKMALWATVEDTEVNKGELFEGVRDEDEPENDITAKVELANYHKVIRSSSAYQWFLASLYREFGLQRKHTMTETISSKILRCLPPEKISKSRTPQTHCVTFELGFPFVPQQGIKLAEMIAVTGFPDEAQVTTVEEYVRYMWPCDGLRLLRALQMVVDSSRVGKYLAGSLTFYANGIFP
ncbi:hypothetical protein CEP52_016067 [Fusarium oligoseptatum]|uniref:Uncharacterized protein n=1 Tax=Fusarium oligoseptatum TaxID=2604345 RepID=A0A428S7A1_9HYPO|nr:hypothetical protein CEP52_016067 [Fusarium oligoseptatum]